jgi:hypothetical protein
LPTPPRREGGSLASAAPPVIADLAGSATNLARSERGRDTRRATSVSESPYGPRQRQTNRALIDAILDARDDTAFSAACNTFVGDFHPSLLAELDLLELRWTGREAEFVVGLAEHLFVLSLAANLRARRFQLHIDAVDLARIETELAAFTRAWVRTPEAARAFVVQEFTESWQRTIGAGSDAVEAGFCEREIERLRRELAELGDLARLANVADVAVQNALLVLLDIPNTRKRAQIFVREWRKMTSFPYLPAVPRPFPKSADPIREVSAWLTAVAHQAGRNGLAPVAEVAEAAIDLIQRLSPAQLGGFDGDRVTGLGSCGRCAMSFADEVLQTIDFRCPFFHALGENLIYWPSRLNVTECRFCGHATVTEHPMMFFAPGRQQVVYLLPARPGLTHADLIELYRPALAGIRDQYASRLTPNLRAVFERSPELLTTRWAEFVYAAHMGETVQEDHVYNIVGLRNGSGLVHDLSKGFVRELVESELEQYREHPGCIETGPLAYSNLLQAERGLEALHVDTQEDELFRARQLAVTRHLVDRVRPLAATADVVGWRGIVREFRH